MSGRGELDTLWSPSQYAVIVFRGVDRMWRVSLAGIALTIAAVLVAVLAWQNRGLRTERDHLTDRAAYAYPGMYVPIVEATTIDGARVRLGAPEGERQVLFFFNHTCPHCRASAPQVVALARALRERPGDRAEMIGVCQCSPAQARTFVRDHGLGFPVVVLDDRRSIALFRARGVPALMAIDREGRVRHAVQGVIDTREQVDALIAALARTEAPVRPTPRS